MKNKKTENVLEKKNMISEKRKLNEKIVWKRRQVTQQGVCN